MKLFDFLILFSKVDETVSLSTHTGIAIPGKYSEAGRKARPRDASKKTKTKTKTATHTVYWTLEDLGNKIYAIRSVSSHLYLDGRGPSDSDPLMTNRQPIGDNYLQWTFESTGDNKYAIKSVSSGRYLDGRGGESNPLVTARNPQGDNYLQWVLEVML